MKQVLLLLLLLPLAAFSQRIQSDQLDEFGKSRRIATARLEFGTFTTSLAGTVTIKSCDTLLSMSLFFRAGKATYTDEKTKALLHLQNGETIQFFNTGKYKELTATEPGFVVFDLNEPEKIKLRNHKVIAYTIHTAKAAINVELNDVQQNAFYKTIDLLESQARSMAIAD